MKETKSQRDWACRKHEDSNQRYSTSPSCLSARDLNAVVSQLCEWAFSDAESREQFRIWLDEAYPAEGDAEEVARGVGEEAAEEEGEIEEESEEESHEHRD